MINRFDTFFHPTGQQYPPEFPCKVDTSGDGDWETGDVLKLRPSHKRRKTLESKEPPDVSKFDADSNNQHAQPGKTSPEPIIRPSSFANTSSMQGQAMDAAVGELVPETRDESFTTGPSGTPTHWKQTVFLLKTPIEVTRGRAISIVFYDIADWVQGRKFEGRLVAGRMPKTRESSTSSFDIKSSTLRRRQTRRRMKIQASCLTYRASKFVKILHPLDNDA